MILTITLNPAVDISYKLGKFSLDTVNRVGDVSKTAGGKGLNVARVLHLLGEEVAASGFLGGSLGGFMRSQIEMLDIKDLFVEIAGETRNCIAIIHEGKQTEILEAGPVISDKEASVFLEEFTKSIKQVDIVTISGSLPKGLPTDFYKKTLDIANLHGARVLVDTNGALLASILKNENKPYFIKPNAEELADLLGEKTLDEVQIREALTLSLFANIPWVVVTLGADGAIIKYGDRLYRVKAPKVEAINPVGSGDSVVAGFAAGYVRGLVDEDLMKFGLSMGVLNAMEEKTGHVDVENMVWVVEQMKVERIG